MERFLMEEDVDHANIHALQNKWLLRTLTVKIRDHKKIKLVDSIHNSLFDL